MTAETLRKAAALIRERAEAVDGWYTAEAWATTAPMNLPIERADAAHIASWHPAVALAVADWLDAAGADIWAHGPLCECGTGCDACDDNLWEPHSRAALAVARAYLGESS